jgi:hypothetical protein
MPVDTVSKLAIILAEVKDTPWYRFTGPGPATRARLPDDAQPGTYVLMSEHLAVLRALYEQLDESRRKHMVGLLPTLWYSDACGSVVVHFLTQLKEFNLLTRVATEKPQYRATILSTLNARVLNEPYTFADTELERIAQLVRGLTADGDLSTAPAEAVRLNGTIARVRYLRLRDQLLEGRNPEINADQQEVGDRISRLGFRKPVAAALRDVETKMSVATSGFDFKACIDLTRTALEEVLEESSQAIEERYGTAAPTKGHHAPYLQHLTNAGLLLKDEQEALQKLYNLLSNEGAHSLEAAKEQAHVYRAVTVEWLLLITGRVQTYLK